MYAHDSMPSPVPRHTLPTPTPRRWAIWLKTNGHCWYCGALFTPWFDFHLDHFLPRCEGGPSRRENMVPACATCNLRKGKQPLESFRERLQREALGDAWFSDGQIAYLATLGVTLPLAEPWRFWFEGQGL